MTPSALLPITCPPLPTEEDSEGTSLIEQRVIGVFRLWHLIFLSAGGLVAFMMLVCCVVKARVPRTKQDIEADFKRKKITRKFRRHLDKLVIEDTDFKNGSRSFHRRSSHRGSFHRSNFIAAMERVQKQMLQEIEAAEKQNGDIAKSQSETGTPASSHTLQSKGSIVNNEAAVNEVKVVVTADASSISSAEEDIRMSDKNEVEATSKAKPKKSAEPKPNKVNNENNKTVTSAKTNGKENKAIVAHPSTSSVQETKFSKGSSDSPSNANSKRKTIKANKENQRPPERMKIVESGSEED